MKLKQQLTILSYLFLFFSAIIMKLYYKSTLGCMISTTFVDYFIIMIKMLVPVLILIGLFEVWVKNTVIEKCFGEQSGMKGYILAFLFGAITIGPMIVSFPIAYSLHKKGASLTIVLIYVGSATTLRIPMTFFEISFMGIVFSVTRIIVASLLIFTSSYIVGKLLTSRSISLPSID